MSEELENRAEIANSPGCSNALVSALPKASQARVARIVDRLDLDDALLTRLGLLGETLGR